MEQFDHVKNDLELDDEEGEGAASLVNLKKEGISEDMQRMLNKLHTPAATQVSQSSQAYTTTIRFQIQK